jgi:hypothetical protein
VDGALQGGPQVSLLEDAIWLKIGRGGELLRAVVIVGGRCGDRPRERISIWMCRNRSMLTPISLATSLSAGVRPKLHREIV